MKTYFIFLCLLVSGGFASATIQTTADQDKPARLYLKSYTENTSGSMNDYESTLYQTSSNAWDFEDIDWGTESLNESGNYTDGSASSFSYNDSYLYYLAETGYPTVPFVGYDDSTISGQAGYWPNINSVPYTETEAQLNWGSNGDWTNNSTGYGLPVLMEYCNVKTPIWDYSYSATYAYPNSGEIDTYNDTETYSRTVQATWHLQTGGKALSVARNLFCIFGGAGSIDSTTPEYYDVFPIFPAFQSFGNTGIIPSQNIAIGSYGNLGSDGNLYVALPDNADVDVTPYVAGADDYTFGVSAQKYELKITANTNDLSTTTPEFCVGQQVNLQAAWSPSLPSGAQPNYQWIASLDFVNAIVPPSTNEASTNYVLDLTLLTNNSASVWWYNGGYKYLWCNVTCQFTNGQTATVTGEGNVSIFRPQVHFVAGSPAMPMLADGFLELGNIDNISNMTFAAQVTSETNFPGLANWTQLNERAVTLPFDSTYGQYWLDNDQFYNSGVGNFPPSTTININGTVFFSDNPGINDVGIDYESLTDSFETYLVFKPNGSNNIWVTLGIVNWGWSATQLAWVITSSSVTAPTYTDSDAFPTWLNTAFNRQ